MQGRGNRTGKSKGGQRERNRGTEEVWGQMQGRRGSFVQRWEIVVDK